MVTVNDLVAQLEALPGVDDPWFPPRLNSCIFRIVDVRPLLDAIVSDDRLSLEVRFKAFYGYLNHARRSLDYTEFDRYYDLHADNFVQFPMSWLLKSQKSLNHVQAGERSLDLWTNAEYFAEKARQLLPNHFGVQAHWATVVAAVQGALAESDRNLDQIREAIRAQQIALVDSRGEYPRYYMTKAELLRLTGDLDRAMDSIAIAIDKEDSSLADYPVRIGRYEAIRVGIEAERRFLLLYERSAAELRSLREGSERAHVELSETRNSMLTLVGLLAAIVAFVTTSTSLTARLQLHDAIRLIAISSAGIVVVFSSILWLVSSSTSWTAARKYMMVIGAALILAAVVLAYA